MQIPASPQNGYPWRCQVMTDYPESDDAYHQVAERLAAKMPPDTVIVPSPVSEFDPFGLGWRLATLALVTEDDCPRNRIFVTNSAPRKNGCENCEGGHFVYAGLPHGQQFYGANEGHTLSFVRKHIVGGKVFILDVPKNGYQFRSEALPEAVRRHLCGDHSVVLGEISVSEIPEVPGWRMRSDNFGNIKLTVGSDDPFLFGRYYKEEVVVEINGITRIAHLGENIFDGPPGSLVLAVGSTSHEFPRPQNPVRYLELAVPGGHANLLFRSNSGDPQRDGIPRNGSEVKARWLERRRVCRCG